MKKYALLLFYLIIAASAFAQLNKNQLLAGGTGDFSYSGQKESYNGFSQNNKITGLSVDVDGGYFIMDKLCIGLGVGGTIANTTQNTSSISAGLGIGNGRTDTIYTATITKFVSKSSGFGFTPFVRYYFLNKNKNINFLGQFSYTHSFSSVGYNNVYETYSYVKGSPPDPNSITSGGAILPTVKTQTNALAIQAGPSLFIGTKLSLEVLLGWKYYQNDHITSNSFTIGAGFHTHFGK